MNRLISALLLMSLTCSLALANEIRVGFVNTERVFRESPLAVKAQKKLEKEFQSREQDIQKMLKQARDLQSYLEREAMTLPDMERSKKQKELSSLSREVDRAKREFREDLNQRKNEEFSSVQERARKIIIEISEKEKFDLVLENVVYASPRVDITERVLKALDR